MPDFGQTRCFVRCQLPFVDLRALTFDNSRLKRPSWPDPRPNEFVRNLGTIKGRPLGGPQSAILDHAYCEAGRWLHPAHTSEELSDGVRARLAHTRLFGDRFNYRIELGVVITKVGRLPNESAARTALLWPVDFGACSFSDFGDQLKTKLLEATSDTTTTGYDHATLMFAAPPVTMVEWRRGIRARRSDTRLWEGSVRLRHTNLSVVAMPTDPRDSDRELRRLRDLVRRLLIEISTIREFIRHWEAQPGLFDPQAVERYLGHVIGFLGRKRGRESGQLNLNRLYAEISGFQESEVGQTASQLRLAAKGIVGQISRASRNAALRNKSQFPSSPVSTFVFNGPAQGIFGALGPVSDVNFQNAAALSPEQLSQLVHELRIMATQTGQADTEDAVNALAQELEDAPPEERVPILKRWWRKLRALGPAAKATLDASEQLVDIYQKVSGSA